MNLIVGISDEAWGLPGVNLKTRTLKSGFPNGFPFAQHFRKFHFLQKLRGLLLTGGVRADRLGGPKACLKLSGLRLPSKPLADTTGSYLAIVV